MLKLNTKTFDNSSK